GGRSRWRASRRTARPWFARILLAVGVGGRVLAGDRPRASLRPPGTAAAALVVEGAVGLQVVDGALDRHQPRPSAQGLRRSLLIGDPTGLVVQRRDRPVVEISHPVGLPGATG